QTGVAVKPLYITTTAKNGKVSYRAKKQSALYAIRVGATENDDGSYTLPSDWVKLKAGGLEAPKAVKPDYKNERVKPPRGTMYSLRDSRGVGDGRKTVDLDEGQWTYRSMPTRKKAPGATVSHQVAPRAEFDPGTTALQNGKLNADKKLEFLYNGSWSGFKAPQGPQTSEILVRVKPSGKPKSTMSYTSAQAGSATMRDSPHASGTAEMAKAGQWVPEQTVLLASLEYSFTYEWGEFANDRGKTVSGILSYKFTKLED
ncbi:MAG: hypothetical protein FWH06_08365, partial [Oscillospiraceae bacterium]|nr:hypothetical protein [Oscillospiraceae bacterium]